MSFHTRRMTNSLSLPAEDQVKTVELRDDLKLPFMECNSNSVPKPSKEESSFVGVVPRNDEGDALKKLKRGRDILHISQGLHPLDRSRTRKHTERLYPRRFLLPSRASRFESHSGCGRDV
jgi:hypothetical protein